MAGKKEGKWEWEWDSQLTKDLTNVLQVIFYYLKIQNVTLFPQANSEIR